MSNRGRWNRGKVFYTGFQKGEEYYKILDHVLLRIGDADTDGDDEDDGNETVQAPPPASVSDGVGEHKRKRGRPRGSYKKQASYIFFDYFLPFACILAHDKNIFTLSYDRI